jgi:hypothetical protein
MVVCFIGKICLDIYNFIYEKIGNVFIHNKRKKFWLLGYSKYECNKIKKEKKKILV